ncbi:hypothetical protein [Bradyrhizobium sp. CCBAU 51745]|uniref:hypothetical protein n=1 Tax=Bradyrhizobium sp. CCBAU 51745 TaxID=1325099 RepID=UPI0023068337|nr:hypothetical protein [Bradyrhizobium sp. CCBAU 51745]
MTRLARVAEEEHAADLLEPKLGHNGREVGDQHERHAAPLILALPISLKQPGVII